MIGMGLLLPETINRNSGRSQLPYLGVVGTRGAIPSRFNVNVQQIMSRTAHYARSGITSAQLVTTNWFVDIFPGNTYLETGTGITQIRTASFEYPSGTYHQIKWNGSVSIVEADGSTNVSDSVVVVIPAGSVFFVNMFVTNLNGITYFNEAQFSPANVALGDKTDLGFGSLVDHTLSPFNDVYASQGYINLPVAILAATTNSSVYLIGSSRTEGIYDISDSSGDLGITARSIGPYFGYTNAGIAGDSIARFIASHAKRVALAQYFSHVLIEGPTNDDISNPATYQANLQTMWGYFPTKKVLAVTCDPETSSSDNWATTMNQSVTKDFSGVNSYINGKPSPLINSFDITTVTSSQVAGKWNANGTPQKWTPDGTHETQFANLSIQTAGIIPPSAITR